MCKATMTVKEFEEVLNNAFKDFSFKGTYDELHRQVKMKCKVILTSHYEYRIWYVRFINDMTHSILKLCLNFKVDRRTEGSWNEKGLFSNVHFEIEDSSLADIQLRHLPIYFKMIDKLKAIESTQEDILTFTDKLHKAKERIKKLNKEYGEIRNLYFSRTNKVGLTL